MYRAWHVSELPNEEGCHIRKVGMMHDRCMAFWCEQEHEHYCNVRKYTTRLVVTSRTSG